MDYDAELRLHNEILRRACAIRCDERVLDIGCGTGQTTLDAARAAAAGSVLGVDTSAAMIALARERAEAARLHNVRFDQGDAQVHDFPSGHFDAAISRYGTMFFDDPVVAFGNIRRALRAGGRLIMMVWQNHAANEWAVAIQRGLAPDDSSPRVPAGAPGPDPFSLGDPASVARILNAAGFVEPTFSDVHERVYYGASVDAALDWVRGFLCTQEMLRRLDAASAEHAIERLRGVLAERQTNDGVWFGSRAWIVTAQRSLRSGVGDVEADGAHR